MNQPGAAAGWFGSWRAALRVSRREVRRHRARNLLIVAMLALPVLGTVAADTIVNSTENLTASEQLTRRVGGFDALVLPTDDQPIYQSTDAQPDFLDVQQGSGGPSDTAAQFAASLAAAGGRIHAVLPQGTLVPESNAVDVFAHGPAGYATTDYFQLDLTDPGFQGVVDLTAGRAPRNAGEIDVSPAAAGRLGVRLGDKVTLPGTSMKNGEAATFTVVGLMRKPDATQDSSVFALPAAPAAANESVIGWFVHQSGGVNWSQVSQLNKAGILVTSRAVVLDPPPASQVPYVALQAQVNLQASNQGINVPEAAVAAITVGIALLEVILLAGPAFAVSARRREREYAMLGAAGADGVHLRRMVLADGVLLGAIAGVCGVALGIGAAAAVMPLVPSYNGILPGALHVNALHAAGVALLAVVLGLCSAYVPARSAARRDLAAALSGKRPVSTPRARRGRVALGLLFAAAGLCGVFLCRRLFGDASAGLTSLSVVAGVALVEIGGILCTPAIVAAVAGLGRFLPLGPRLALRDSARNPGRTTPAVAAMFAAVAGAVAAGGWLDSSLAQQRAEYRPQLLGNQVAVAGVANPKQAAQILDALRAVMPVTGSVLTQSVGPRPVPGDATGTWTLTLVPQVQPASEPGSCAEDQFLQFGSDGSIGGQCMSGTNLSLNQDLIGDAQTLRTVTGLDDARAQAVLARGGIVLFGPPGGSSISLDVLHQYTTKQHPGAAEQSTKTLTVPALYEPDGGVPDPVFVLAPATAHALGLDGGGNARTLIVNLSGPVTADQAYGGTQVLNRLGVDSPLLREPGLQSRLGLANLIVLLAAMLVAIGAAAIATGLALADGRSDQETLSAVGGSPWTRRWLAGSTALVVTGLGVLIGVPVGLAISAGLVRVDSGGDTLAPLMSYLPGTARLSFHVPWLDLGGLALAVPLLTALGAVLLSRSKSPGSGRVAD